MINVSAAAEIHRSSSSRPPDPSREARGLAGRAGVRRWLAVRLLLVVATQTLFVPSLRAAEVAKGHGAQASPASPPGSAQVAAGPGAGELDSHLPGQLSSDFAINDANPEASVPTNAQRDSSPLEFGYYLQDLLERAEQARKAKDFSAVIRYYRAVAKAVPDNAKGWSKLCEAYEIVNDRERAIRACRYAIDRPAAELQDYVRYVHLILGQNGPLDAPAKKELNQVLAHLDEQPTTGIVANHLRCETGVKLKDVPMLEACTAALAKAAPDDPKTVVFQWSLAVLKGHTEEARNLLIRARATGVVAENVARMEEVTLSSSGLSRRGKAGILVATILLLAAGAAVAVTLRRRRGLGAGGATA